MDKDAKVRLTGSTSLLLSPRYSEKNWKDAFDGREDWEAAIKIVEDRIKGRWLDAADRLMNEPDSNPRFGFAILALDCVVLESLWGFMNGKPAPSNKEQSKQVYRDILTRPSFGFCDDLSDRFRDLVRNSIMHDGETRSRWLVKSAIPHDVVARKSKDGDYEVNRTKFHGSLKAVFENWLALLRNGDMESRNNLRKRMEEVIEKHHAPWSTKPRRSDCSAGADFEHRRR